MLRYKIDEEKLKEAVLEQGYSSISSFAKKNDFNRATLHHYLNGKGPFSEPYYLLCDLLKKDPLDLLAPIFADLNVPDIDMIGPIIKSIIQKTQGVALLLLNVDGKSKIEKWELGLTQGANKLSSYDYLGIKGICDPMAEKAELDFEVYNLDQADSTFLKSLSGDPHFLGGNQVALGYFMGVLDGARRQI